MLVIMACISRNALLPDIFLFANQRKLCLLRRCLNNPYCISCSDDLPSASFLWNYLRMENLEPLRVKIPSHSWCNCIWSTTSLIDWKVVLNTNFSQTVCWWKEDKNDNITWKFCLFSQSQFSVSLLCDCSKFPKQWTQYVS
jgi:hypothetical protein